MKKQRSATVSTQRPRIGPPLRAGGGEGGRRVSGGPWRDGRGKCESARARLGKGAGEGGALAMGKERSGAGGGACSPLTRRSGYPRPNSVPSIRHPLAPPTPPARSILYPTLTPTPSSLSSSPDPKPPPHLAQRRRPSRMRRARRCPTPRRRDGAHRARRAEPSARDPRRTRALRRTWDTWGWGGAGMRRGGRGTRGRGRQ